MINPLDFSGKNIWVTGAGRGIGLEVANLFMKHGANVIGFDLAFEQHDYNFQCVLLDISDENAVQQAIQDICVKSKTLDVLVNSAAILPLGNIDETSIEDFKHCFNVNTVGSFLMIKHSMPMFKKQKSGAIVTISSNAAKVPRQGMAAYCASKAALSSLSHTAALELAPYGVRCNVVCPGSTNTEMQRMLWTSDESEQKTIAGFPKQYKLGIPLGKIAQPNDVAQVVLFFASTMANHITVQDIVVDGGATLNA